MMINTIPPGSRGSLAAFRAAVAGRDLAILPRLPGEIVYFLPTSALTQKDHVRYSTLF